MVVVAALSFLFLFRPWPTILSGSGEPSYSGAPTSASSEIKSVAVLPLENLSGDPAQEYFADGMTESLINNLARIRALKVISRTSVMRYKGSQKSLPEIARELNVDAIIEGSVQRSGGLVRVTAQLIHAATDSHVWASEYERDLTDVLKLQSDVARAVADEIRIQVTAEERARLASARSVNPQAHEAYLLGRHHFSKYNEKDSKKAIEYFERAIALAPDYAAAYAGLSDARIFQGLTGTVDFKAAESPTRAAALKAIELDEQLAEAHLSLARIKQQYDWDWAGAEQEIKRALELDPGSLAVHTDYGYLFMHLGRHDEAIREGQIAVQLDPVSSAAHSALGRFLYRAHRYEEALPHLLRAVELEPRGGANVRLGDLYAQLGRYDEAIAAYERAREAIPKGGNFQAAVARVFALMGRRREARRMVSGLKANPYIIAAVYAALGDKDEAFKILEKAVEEHQLITPLKVEPPLESLHSDPRWKALLRRMNFPLE
jgi:TolB-like protein/Tfp pilus assembly protein PilF